MKLNTIKTNKVEAIKKAMASKVNKDYRNQGNKQAHARIKKAGIDFNKI